MQKTDQFPNELLLSGALKLGINLTYLQLEAFRQFTNLLLEWNERINLTRIVDPTEIVLKHYLDSLSIAQVLDAGLCKSMLDVGTGAGFPGIPLKIAYPNISIVLLDSVKKRLSFIDSVIKELRLTDVLTLHERAENLGQNKMYREKFDLVTSRAVAKLNVLAELCIPLCKPGGRFVSYKGPNHDDEVEEAQNAIRICGGEIERIENIVLPDSDIQRALIVIKKTKSTPKIYPRNAGIPSKQPIF
jgi:16S rRNA (guanine527-N7)-methyltransferase